MINLEALNDCLQLVGAIHHIKITPQLVETYQQALEDIDEKQLAQAFRVLIDEAKFPTPARIKELAGVHSTSDDWYQIMSVIQESIKSATISGISAAALIKITSSNGIRSALLKIGQTEDSYQLNRYRSDWLKEVNKPNPSNTIAPASVAITLEVPRYQQDVNYPTDDDYSVRTASLIKLLRSGEIKPSTVVNCSTRFPVKRIEEIAAAMQEMGFDLESIATTKNEAGAIGKIRSISARLGQGLTDAEFAAMKAKQEEPRLKHPI